MSLPLLLLIFCLGSIVGSFLNVCIHRLPREESIVSPPSHCPLCKAPVRPYDNIPIMSYLILRGRCRSCGGRITPRYFIVEFVTGLSFVWMGLAFASSVPMILISIAFISSLIVVVFVDLEHQIIPDEISLGGAAAGVIVSAVYPSLHHAHSWQAALARSLAGLAAGAGIFWLIRLGGGKIFRKEAMGLGDVKLMAYAGSLLGARLVLLNTFLAALIGSAVGLSLIAAGRANLTSRIPFGPFICAGAVIAFLYGDGILAWYFGLFQ